MRVTVSLLLALICTSASGQAGKDVGIIHKHEKYYLTKSCYDVIKWDEVVLKNKAVTDRINAVIRKSVRSYKLTKGDASLRCDKSMNFSRTTEFKVVYQKNNLISYYLSSDTYYKGVLHDFHRVNTLNFDSRTGRQIGFNDLIDTANLASVDSLIIKKISLERTLDGLDSSELISQLQDKSFNIRDNGIRILYWDRSYPMDILITYKELKPFGLLRKFDASK
jgi:hypothetical protein